MLVVSAMALLFIGWVLWRYVPTPIPLYMFAAVFGTVWLIALNFFRCPIRKFADDDVNTDRVVVAPADGKVVVIEEVMEDKYLHEKRIMVSIFMSLFNVHANWFPVDGKVKMVHHQNGRFHRAWLPKASDENEKNTRLLVFGSIYYMEQQYDSALSYLETVYENNNDVAVRIQVAEYLLNILE